MGYNLPDHELFILNREYGISYRKLAEEWECGQSTIGNHVRQFEEYLDNGDVDVIDLYEVTSMKFKSVPEYVDMIEDMKMEQNDNYTDELNGITDASPEECQTEELREGDIIEIDDLANDPVEQILDMESAEDRMPVGVRRGYGTDENPISLEEYLASNLPWYKRLWNWVKEMSWFESARW